MKTFDHVTGAIIYRKSWVAFYIRAIFIGTAFLFITLCIGLMPLIGDPVEFPIIFYLLSLTFAVPLVFWVGHMLCYRRLYRVTLYGDRVEWLDGRSVGRLMMSEITRVKMNTEGDVLLYVDLQHGQGAAAITTAYIKHDPAWIHNSGYARISRSLFGCRGEIGEFISETLVRSRNCRQPQKERLEKKDVT